MSKLGYAGLVLLLGYALLVWGQITFILLIILAVGCNKYRQIKGRWPWTSAMLLASGKSQEVAISESRPKVTFADVAGIDESMEELLEIVDFIKNKDKYSAVGAKMPKGALMCGPPGVGKTLCARAIAGEASVPVIEMAGSSFVNKYVGVGADSIRQLFARAKQKAPCIIFIDEFDSLGKRGDQDSGGDREYDQTINQLLVEMDGFSTSENVFLLAATNRMDKIDEAILRPGRFDRKIHFHRPDINGREAILKVHSKGKKIAEDVVLRNIASRTPGFTGADLANIMNEAAIMAGKAKRTEISESDILLAREKQVLGKENKSIVMSDEEKKIIAYHETGHGLLAALLDNCDQPDKLSIIPRDMALGITSLTPGKDRYNVSKDFLRDQIVMLLGGRAAEKIACGTETAGAKDDIERATSLTTAMVCEYGMSDNLGPIAINISRGYGADSMLQQRAQAEIMKLMKDSYERAQSILSTNMDSLHAIANLLLEKETISGDDVINLINKSPKQ